MIERLNRYFIPLYVDNAAVEKILLAAGRRPYRGKEWQLVQTHLIEPSGALRELWRPQADSGATDALDLVKALDRAIVSLSLKEGAPLPGGVASSLGAEESRVFESVIRFDLDRSGDYLGRPRFALDRVGFGEDDLAALLPGPSLADGALSFEVPREAAARLLISLRPPLDTAQDPEEDALAGVTLARLHGTPVMSSPKHQLIALDGALRIERPDEAGPPPKDPRFWSELIRVELSVRGFLVWNPTTRQLVDLQLLTDGATAALPGGGELRYRGMVRPRCLAADSPGLRGGGGAPDLHASGR